METKVIMLKLFNRYVLNIQIKLLANVRNKYLMVELAVVNSLVVSDVI